MNKLQVRKLLQLLKRDYKVEGYDVKGEGTEVWVDVKSTYFKTPDNFWDIVNSNTHSIYIDRKKKNTPVPRFRIKIKRNRFAKVKKKRQGHEYL